MYFEREMDPFKVLNNPKTYIIYSSITYIYINKQECLKPKQLPHHKLVLGTLPKA